jgi:hypothetical protein
MHHQHLHQDLVLHLVV